MLRRSLTLALLPLSSAQAAPELYAQFWGDALPLPPPAEQRLALNRARLWLCPARSVADVQAEMSPVVRDLQQTLDRMDRNDPARATLQQALDGLKATPQATASPAQPSAAPLTLAQALSRTRTWLNTHESAGMKALHRSPEGQSAALANAFALGAALAGRPEAALAALLTAHTLEPKNADTLVNLGGALAALNQPAEALAVLTEAERLGIAPGGAMGVPVLAVALNNRGRALLELGQFSAANRALRQALTLAPTLAEANQNLARALLCQGKTEEAVRFVRLGTRHTPVSSEAGQPLPVRPPGPIAPAPPADPVAVPGPGGDGESRLAAKWVFDLSHGQAFTLPDLKIAQTPAGMVALREQYRALKNMLDERSLALGREQDAVEQQLRQRHGDMAATEARRGAIWNAVITSGREPELKALDNRFDRTEWEAATIWGDFWHCEGGCKIANIINQADGDEKVFRSLCVPQLEAEHGRWRNAMHASANDLGAFLKASYRYETALAANYSDPLWQKRATLHTQQWVTGAFSGLVKDALVWADDIHTFEKGCLEGASPSPDASPVAAPLDLPPPDLCQQLVGKFTTSISLGVVDAGFGCDKVSLKLAPSGLLTTFTKVELDTSADKWKTTVILGVQGGGSLKEVLGLGVKASVGSYVSMTRDGVQDFGLVGDVKSSFGLPLGDKMPIGQVKVGESAKALSVRWSFVTGDTEFDLAH